VGILRSRDLDVYGIPREYLKRLLDLDMIKKSGRGLYIPSDADIKEHHSLAENCKKIPNGII